jgi:hypothetical protein
MVLDELNSVCAGRGGAWPWLAGRTFTCGVLNGGPICPRHKTPAHIVSVSTDSP